MGGRVLCRREGLRIRQAQRVDDRGQGQGERGMVEAERKLRQIEKGF